MKNFMNASLKNGVFFLLLGLFLFTQNALAAKKQAHELRKQPLEVPGEEIRREEEAKIVKPMEKIEELDKGMPEIPQPITREHPGAADQVELESLEHELAKGTITETEYQLKKDTLMRQSNIKF